MLQPFPGESQPDFAIRFHAEMAGTIPGTDRRNQACLNAWRNSPNHQQLVKSVDSRFPVSQYRRVRNVHCFEEHELPEETLPDGSKVPPKKYSRTELAEMVDGMNRRILDHEHFSPLSKGHTVVDQSGNMVNDPDVLGYTGPYYLGQVGETNPRWGIFEDEYHRLEAVPELDRRRSRSPEVWPYKNARDRFFHPVAALGAEMPRLNLMPARYSRTLGPSGERVFVEIYSATSPFGGNTSAPSFGPADPEKKAPAMPDMYAGGPPADQTPAPGQDQQAPTEDGGGDIPGMVEEIISGLMETPPFQFLMQLYNERQNSDAQPPMAGGSSPDPAAAAAPAAPAAAPPVATPAVPMPSAAPPAAPPAPAPPQDPNRQQYSRRHQDLEAELAATRELAARERSARVRLERYSRLNELAAEFYLVPDEELERTSDYTDEQFASHCSMISERYSRNPQHVPDFQALSSFGDPASPRPGLRTPANAVTKEDSDKIADLAVREGVSYGSARDIYMRNKAAVS